jgi:hypothetical protein
MSIKNMKRVEGCLNNILERVKAEGDFAIISAFLPYHTNDNNQERNEQLLGKLKSSGIGKGFFIITGFWKEEQEGGTFIGHREEFFLFTRPESLPVEEFRQSVIEAYRSTHEELNLDSLPDIAIISLGEEVHRISRSKGRTKLLSSKSDLTLKLLEDKYSDLRKEEHRVKGPIFKFEGHLSPNSFVNALGVGHNGIRWI